MFYKPLIKNIKNKRISNIAFHLNNAKIVEYVNKNVLSF